LIDIQQVTKQFGRLKALDNVSVQLTKGNCTAFIGPNGSGKTTLIKALLGMIMPNTGEILINGECVLNKWKYRNDIGYMPQIGRYPDNMSIGQMLQMIQDIRKHQGEEIDTELIELYKLNEISSKKMLTLSGGTRQKVSAAIAFMFKPSILILDEPTAGLDPVASEILKEKIIKEQSNNKLIIITSHVLSELDDLATEVLYMQEGKCVFHKPVEEIKSETAEHKLSKAIRRLVYNF
jgi:Cu-processing system ATP-binding protein